jgi:hypothetical protein
MRGEGIERRWADNWAGRRVPQRGVKIWVWLKFGPSISLSSALVLEGKSLMDPILMDEEDGKWDKSST